MKSVIFPLVLTTGLLANAAVLDCTVKVINYNTGKITKQAIEIAPTDAVDFEAEAGEVFVDSYKLGVYRNLTGDATALSISKKIHSLETPYLVIASSSAHYLQAGQEISLSAVVESQSLRISCSVK